MTRCTTPVPEAITLAPPIRSETETAVRDFVRDAVSRQLEILKSSAEQFEDRSWWERGSDGNLRERRVRERWFRVDSLESFPDYQRCIKLLKSEAIVAKHLDRLVGTSLGSSSFEAEQMLRRLIYAMRDDAGQLVFTEERFHEEWRGLVEFLVSDAIPRKMVAPLPYLSAPFPLELNNELVLDRLNDDEVNRCFQAGVLRSFPGFPFIDGAVAVGIRRTGFLPKLIGEPNPPFDPLDEGSFGKRPLFQEDLLVGDIISALRLFKPGRIHIAGFATWADCPWVLGGISFRILGRWPCHGQFELSAGEVAAFRELWQLLEGEGKRFAFSVDRFNLAFDRGLLNDRLVDLVIAAESLFLGDKNKDRGELGYRLALRAAKFIEHPDYNEKDIFLTMREAYNARSAIVHGGSPTQTRLPHNRDANLATFMEAFEDLVRRGLRKALDMKSDGRMLREPAYWDDLVLSGPRPR